MYKYQMLQPVKISEEDNKQAVTNAYLVLVTYYLHILPGAIESQVCRLDRKVPAKLPINTGVFIESLESQQMIIS